MPVSSLEKIKQRKPARTVRAVAPEVLKLLNHGKIETANLVEGLAMDFAVLAKAAEITSAPCAETGVVKRMAFYGAKISDWRKFKDHPSDTVRGFACYALAESTDLSFARKLQAMQHFADDAHFGVREWAWLALRPKLADNLTEALELLPAWTRSPSANIRRFASEATRPRGVWCNHIDRLKAEPALALPILEPLNQDSSKYVRDAVGNWLNDASKTQPKWVQGVAARWKKLKNPHTDAILKKALRSL